MSLLTPKTQLETDLADKDASIIRCAEAAHHFASILQNENARFWSLPTDRLLAVLNHDVTATLAMFEANTQAGESVNAILDLLDDPRFPTRAPVVAGRSDIAFDGTAFSYTAPVIEEPTQEPEPTPDENA